MALFPHSVLKCSRICARIILCLELVFNTFKRQQLICEAKETRSSDIITYRSSELWLSSFYQSKWLKLQSMCCIGASLLQLHKRHILVRWLSSVDSDVFLFFSCNSSNCAAYPNSVETQFLGETVNFILFLFQWSVVILTVQPWFWTFGEMTQ